MNQNNYNNQLQRQPSSQGIQQDQYTNNDAQQQQKPKPQVEYELYKRLKLIGEGSFGKAYLVESLRDGRKWVIKQVSLEGMSPEEKKESYKEFKILEYLDHPNIVKFKEIYKTKSGKLCIVMEYADGGDLQDRIKKQRGKFFREEQILDWITQICLAMKHVHDRKILHRDLKGQNIFLTSQNVCKLGDFGIARVLSRTFEKAKTMVGTPYYLSPEIINSVPYSFKSDVWSIGVVLYELCTLKPPFTGENLNNLALNIVRGNYQPIPSMYSSDMKKLVANLLSVKAENRFSIQQILSLPLIKNRIKNFLSETIKANEFSHTILHNQNIQLDDDFRNIKNVNGAPPPSVANQLKEQRAEKEKQDKIDQQNKYLPNLQDKKQDDMRGYGQKPQPQKVIPQGNYQGRPETPQYNQVRQVGVKNPSPVEARVQPKKPSSLEVPQSRPQGGKLPSSAQQTPIGKENSSENKKLVRQPSKDVVIKNYSAQTEQSENPSQMSNQQNSRHNPSQPNPQMLKQNPSQQKILQKAPSKPVIQKIQRPQTAAQNIQKQVMTPKQIPSGKPIYPAKPIERKQSVQQAMSNPSKAESKPPTNVRPITAAQRNLTPNKQIGGQVVIKNAVLSREEAAQKRIEHLRVVREQEELKKRKLEEFKKAKFEASLKQKKESEIKRNQMLYDIQQKRKNKMESENGQAVQQQRFSNQQQVQQQQRNKNPKQEIQIEWMGTLKPDQPPERPKYIENELEQQRIAAEKYNREQALRKQQEEEIENKRRIQEQRYEELQREKERKQREMFLQEQLSEDSNPQNYPQKGFAKIQNHPNSQNNNNNNNNKNNGPTREEIEFSKMIMEMKSVIEDNSTAEDTSEENQINLNQQNINYDETDRDDVEFDQDSDAQQSDKEQKQQQFEPPQQVKANKKFIIQQNKAFLESMFDNDSLQKLYKAVSYEMRRNKQFISLPYSEQLKITKQLVPQINLDKPSFQIKQLVQLIQLENY